MDEESLSDEISTDCFVAATHDVGEDRKPIRWMLRMPPSIEPEHCGPGYMQMSGWVLMTGEEIGEVANEMGMYYLKDILKYNPEIVPYLTTPPPCRFERDGNLPVFLDVSEDYPDMK